ncbi:MAG: hypothetical protein PHR66_12000 [Desulfuromonadaceae bacterium]|nr:hypothetical protein [Desulfuromonadaceae bacterium]
MAQIFGIVSLAVLLSVGLNLIVPLEYATDIIDTVALNFLSVLVGLAIALHGMLSACIISRSMNLPEGDNGDKLKSLMKGVMEEIKDNALLSLFSYFAVLISLYIKGINQPLLTFLCLSTEALSIGMNISALALIFLTSYAIYDIAISIMKLQLSEDKK